MTPGVGIGRSPIAHRRQRPPGCVRPVLGGRGGGAGVRPEPRLRRGGAAGPTNCLNFGNPERPEVAWPARPRACPRLADACARAQRAGRRRQRLPLQRDRARPDLPDPGRRHGAASCPIRPVRPGSPPATGTGWSWSARSPRRWPGPNWRNCAGSSTPACRCRSSTLTPPRSRSFAKRSAGASGRARRQRRRSRVRPGGDGDSRGDRPRRRPRRDGRGRRRRR